PGPAGTPAVPTPGSLNNHVERGASRLPPQELTGVCRVGDQNRRVSRSLARFSDWNLRPGYTFHSRNDLTYRVTFSTAQIERDACPGTEHGLERQDVSLGQVRNMDVVSDCGAIRCRIVCSVDFHALPL